MPTLHFKGKNTIWNHHLSVPYHTLDHIEENDIDSDNFGENILIEGDNLVALKALMPEYQNSIKCIYIDPPYNTGKDDGVWVYNDNVNSPLINEWIGNEVGSDDLVKHDKWLCMMTPRLRLLRELLAEDGVIFISIDDYEADHLKILMGEIFGPENFIGLLPTIMNLKGNQDEFGFAGTHEYTLVFAKNKDKAKFFEFNIDDEEIEEWEEDKHGYYKKGANLKASGADGPRENRPNLFYPLLIDEENDEVTSITAEELEKIYDSENEKFDDDFVESLEKKYSQLGYTVLLPSTDAGYMRWRWQHSKVMSEPHNIIISGSGEDATVYKKQRPDLGSIPTKKPKSTFYKPEYSSGNGTLQIKELFGEKAFPNPKPLQLIKDFIRISTEPGDIVLDSFAGSGTTGHAVMQLKKEGLGDRNFILIQMKEDTPEKPDKNICYDITYKRLATAISKNDYDSGFKYLKVSTPIDPETILEGELPTYQQIGKYVYYLATGDSLDKTNQINPNKNFIGEKGSQSIFLIYEPDMDKLTRLALTLNIAEQIINESPGKRRIVYAPACFLDDEFMTKHQIEFVSIPYNLFERNIDA